MAERSSAPDQPPEGLRRRLGLTDAVVIGLGSMIGAGIFAALGPAARSAGAGLPVGLVVAAVIAYCNATSTARLAARYPVSGAPMCTAGSGSESSGGSRLAGVSWWARPPRARPWR